MRAFWVWALPAWPVQVVVFSPFRCYDITHEQRGGQVKWISLFLSLLLLVLPVSWAQDFYGQGPFKLSFGQNHRTGTVSRAVDGDTLKLSNGQTLKLASINAPEIHNTTRLHEEAKRFGKEIWAYRNIGGDAHKRVERILTLGNQKVRWETGAESFDESGNLFAYVYVPVDRLEEGVQPDERVFFARTGGYEIFLNAYLVNMGYAEVTSKESSDRYRDVLFELEQEAKDNQLGIWG